jgi:hypothetical protein
LLRFFGPCRRYGNMLRFCIDLVQSSSDGGPGPTASTIIFARSRLESGSGIFADLRAQEPDPGTPSQSGDLPLYSDRGARPHPQTHSA